MKPIIIWHRRDLRLPDNRAIYEAYKHTQYLIPVFVFDPHFWKSQTYNPDRLRFLCQSLADLDQQYQACGSSLIYLHGEPIEKISQLQNKLSCPVYFNHDTNGIYGMKRDAQAETLGWKGWDNDAIERTGRSDKWHIQAQTYFQDDLLSAPETLSPHSFLSEVSPDDIQDIYTIHSEKTTSEKGGRYHGYQRLQAFRETLPEYTKSISSPAKAENYTSRLSTHISFGTLSLREIYQTIATSPYKQKSFFLTRLFWNQHFTQKLQDNPSLDHKTANPVFAKNYDTIYQPDQERFAHWTQGTTGYPLVDASMRALVKTGFLNFRMRALVASFLTYILKQPWQWGADFMFYHLLDSDRAINYSQWQMQSGMIGVHPNRIYNPTKNLTTYDPDGTFILRYLPELNHLSLADLMRDPETRQAGIFGTLTPPCVSYYVEMRKAREQFKTINPQALEAIKQNPELGRRLSLSGAAAKRQKANQLPDTKEV